MTTVSTKKILSRDGNFLTRGNKALARKETRGLYTPAQITFMIEFEGYVPVASASELDALRNAGSRTMGAGTQWKGSYTTGMDKKYVQVRDVDLGAYNWTTLQQFIGVYDGNEL